jgi:hypothetical protein
MNTSYSKPQEFSRRLSLLLLCLGPGLLLASPGNGADVRVEPTGRMVQARAGHTATLLPSGKVLVVGGAGADAYLATAELYDPATGNWALTTDLPAPRAGHTATLLQNGLVLVAGGEDANFEPLETAVLYDWTTQTWTATGSLNVARLGQTATLLPDSRVLVAGGQGQVEPELSSAKVYDPTSGTWSVTEDMLTSRRYHTATLLLNGKVLVAGDDHTGHPNQTELYDPVTGSWAYTGHLRTGRAYQTATLLPDGNVLVVGGHQTNPPGRVLASTELYDPATGLWSPGGAVRPNAGHWLHTETLLADGTVLVVGGRRDFTPYSFSQIVSYDAVGKSWMVVGELNQARWGHTATLLQNGSVLVAGGVRSFDAPAPIAIAELIEPAIVPLR